MIKKQQEVPTAAYTATAELTAMSATLVRTTASVTIRSAYDFPSESCHKTTSVTQETKTRPKAT